MGLSLEEFPLELLDEILQQFDDVGDVLNLCLVSTKFHAVAAPRLFDLVPVALVVPVRQPRTGRYHEDNDDDDDDDDDGMASALSSLSLSTSVVHLKPAPLPAALLRQARRLELRPDRWNAARNRCYHEWRVRRQEAGDDGGDEDQDENDNDDEDADGPPSNESLSRQVADQLLPHLEAIRDGNLVHFGWELGTCIPDAIAGPDGWLARLHANLQSLTLVTAGPCPCNLPTPLPGRERGSTEGPSRPGSLSRLRNLRSLTWIGLMTPAEIEAAAEVIDRNATRLESMVLDGIDPNARLIYGFEAASDADHLLGLTPLLSSPPLLSQAPSARFPALRELSLANVSLGYHLVAACDWSRLSRLSIRRCPEAGPFLMGLAELSRDDGNGNGGTLGLRLFEFRSHPLRPERGALDAFIASFAGLEEVRLHVERDFDGPGDFLLRALAARHSRSLRALAYEMRRWHRNNVLFRHEDDDAAAGPLVGLGPGLGVGISLGRSDPLSSMGIADLATLTEMRRDNPLVGMPRLECLGLAARTDLLKTILPPLATNTNLKVLHVRMPAGTQVGALDEAFRVTRAALASPADTAAFCAAHPGSFFRFVGWVFGAGSSDSGSGSDDKGLPSVQLLAYGDFSRGTDSDAGFFIRRRQRLPDGPTSPPWDFYPRQGRGGTRTSDLDRLIRKHAEFFSSVPTGTLMEMR